MLKKFLCVGSEKMERVGDRQEQGGGGEGIGGEGRGEGE
jgi:hypothetical protein